MYSYDIDNKNYLCKIVTFGRKFRQSKRIGASKQRPPSIPYLTFGALGKYTTAGVTKIDKTMIYTENVIILESMSPLTLILRTSKVKIILRTTSAIL